MATKQPVPVEHKVLSATAIAGIVGIAVAILNGLEANSQLIGFLPASVQAVVLAVVPGLLVLLGGYRTPHTTRTDLTPDPAAGLDEPKGKPFESSN